MVLGCFSVTCTYIFPVLARIESAIDNESAKEDHDGHAHDHHDHDHDHEHDHHHDHDHGKSLPFMLPLLLRTIAQLFFTVMSFHFSLRKYKLISAFGIPLQNIMMVTTPTTTLMIQVFLLSV